MVHFSVPFCTSFCICGTCIFCTGERTCEKRKQRDAPSYSLHDLILEEEEGTRAGDDAARARACGAHGNGQRACERDATAGDEQADQFWLQFMYCCIQ